MKTTTTQVDFGSQDKNLFGATTITGFSGGGRNGNFGFSPETAGGAEVGVGGDRFTSEG